MKVNVYLCFAREYLSDTTYTYDERLIEVDSVRFERVKQNLPHAYSYYAYVKESDLPNQVSSFMDREKLGSWKEFEGERFLGCWVRRHDNKDFNPKDIDFDVSECKMFGYSK